MANFLADLETSGLLKEDEVVHHENGIEAEGAKHAKSPQGMTGFIQHYMHVNAFGLIVCVDFGIYVGPGDCLQM